MDEQEQRSELTSQGTSPARNWAQLISTWDVVQRVFGWVLLLSAVGILAFYFLGPDLPSGAKVLHARLREVNGEMNSPGVFLLLMTLGTSAVFLIQRMRFGLRALLLVMGGLVLVWLAGNMLPQATLWGWVFAALPALLVVHHGLYLGLMKPPFIPPELLEGEGADVDKIKRELAETQKRYYNTTNIALRYGLPALAIFTIGSVIFHGLTPTTGWSLDKLLQERGLMEAARLGAAGAYVYVLLYLGQRGFRHDITSGAALWCAVTLALGPLLAATISWIWAGGAVSPGAGLGGTESPGTGWTTQALYFGIGMSPRHVAQSVARVAQRLMADPARLIPPGRTTPLAMIRGITPQIEERLAEEGVHDVVGMAMSDPLRLQRSTNFDKHQILGWIDMAILAHALPESWQELEEKGLRGARDLIWYVSDPGPEKDEGLKALATEVKEQLLLRNVAQRLAQDAQAQRILLLYQLIGAGVLQHEKEEPGGGVRFNIEQMITRLQERLRAEALSGTGTSRKPPNPPGESRGEGSAPTPPPPRGQD